MPVIVLGYMNFNTSKTICLRVGTEIMFFGVIRRKEYVVKNVRMLLK